MNQLFVFKCIIFRDFFRLLGHHQTLTKQVIFFSANKIEQKI